MLVTRQAEKLPGTAVYKMRDDALPSSELRGGMLL